jgi:hypothetical protein
MVTGLYSGGFVRAFVRIVFFAAGFAAVFCLGFLAHRDGRFNSALRRVTRAAVETTPAAIPSHPPGEWYPAAGRAKADKGSSALSAEDREILASIGYSGASTAAPASRSGVTVFDEAHAQPGLNLYISGHSPEAALTDMKGRVLHTWKYRFEDLWKDYTPPSYVRITGHQYWRAVRVFPNGDLLAIHQNIGLIKLDKDSKLLWKRRDHFHHDLSLDDQGRIYILNQEIQLRDPADGGEDFIMTPSISLLSPEGEEVRKIQLIPCFENSPYAPLLRRLASSGDLFHANTIQVFDGSLAGRSPLFSKGNVLISIWTLDALAIVDLEEQRVLWAMTGMWRSQHESSLLPTGNMMVLDNRGNGGNSRVLEFDPLSQRVVWSFAGAKPEDFHTEWCGGLQRLANGNTLITETNNGRAFEVTPGGDIVWEFINPNQTQSQGMTLISSLWKVTRLPENFGAEWLAGAGE